MIKKRKRKSLGESLFIIGMLIIPLVHLLIFWFYKNIDSILLAFQTSVSGGGNRWGLDNFVTLFKEFSRSDSNILGALKNTFIFFSFDCATDRIEYLGGLLFRYRGRETFAFSPRVRKRRHRYFGR